MHIENPVCVALDTPDLARAELLAKALKGRVGFLKLGLEFFYANGARGYEAVARHGVPIFLDLKLHDIPNTVASGIKSLMRLAPLPAIVNVHASGGSDMMKAARDAVDGRAELIAVTILTSLSNDDIRGAGFDPARDTGAHAVSLARLAMAAGLDGVVCSPREVLGDQSGDGQRFSRCGSGDPSGGCRCTGSEAHRDPARGARCGRGYSGDRAAHHRRCRSCACGGRDSPWLEVKICGLSTAATLDAALDAGADFVGIVFYPKSPRNVTLETASKLAGRARGRAKIVALVVDADEALIASIAHSVSPDYFQAHGAETPRSRRSYSFAFTVRP